MADEIEEKEVIDKIMKLDMPLIYIRHIYYLRFYELTKTNPIYINIIRDPVDMFVSNYYYRRFGWNGEKALPGKWSTNMTDVVRNMTIGECIAGGHKECTQPWSYIIPFFCGSSHVCLSRNTEALNIAKQRVRDKYTLVGLTEDYSNTIRAFEKLVPSFFAGASKIYKDKGAALHEKSKTSSRKGKF